MILEIHIIANPRCFENVLPYFDMTLNQLLKALGLGRPLFIYSFFHFFLFHAD